MYNKSLEKSLTPNIVQCSGRATVRDLKCKWERERESKKQRSGELDVKRNNT